MAYETDRFRQTFFTESFELLEDMEGQLLALDESADAEALNAIFRCAHSIKGSAGIFGFQEISHFTHILETLLDGMRAGKIATTQEAVAVLLQARDVLLQMVQYAQNGTKLPEHFGDDVADALQGLAGTAGAKPVKETREEKSSSEKRYCISFQPLPELFESGNEPLLILRELGRLGVSQVSCDTTRVPDMDAIALQRCYLSWNIELKTQADMAAVREVFEFVENACELDIALLESVSAANVGSVKEAGPAQVLDKPKTVTTSIRVDTEKVDRLVNLVGEVVITQTMLAAQTRHLPVDQFVDLLRGIEALAQHTRELQEAVMSVRMQPVKSIFSRMPRLVHDTAAKLGKNIRIDMAGESTEVDKTVIEQLGDPLNHMIRNAVDHGIEKPEQRLAAGKLEQGVVRLEASHRGGRILIEVSDDGAGINRQKVLNKAREKQLVAADASLSDHEIDQLIFLPGFSTADTVSDLSGRGVGMDVVKRNIEAIGGQVTIFNQPGQGTRLCVSLPLTLAILDAMIVRVGTEHYIIPIANIVETLRPLAQDLRRTPSGTEILNMRGELLPVLHLSRCFRVDGAVKDPCKGLVVIVENGASKLGVVVDELLGQQQVVIKTLEANTDPVPGIAGASILGDGRVSLILDIPALQQLSVQEKPLKLVS